MCSLYSIEKITNGRFERILITDARAYRRGNYKNGGNGFFVRAAQRSVKQSAHFGDFSAII
jgi:hypothetical protein